MSQRILITDGEHRAALAAVRSLGSAGHEVFVCASRSPSLAGASKHVRYSAVVPDALNDARGFVDAVGDLIARWRIDVLLPITEPSILALLADRSAVGRVRLPFPDPERFRRICHKPTVLETARSLGIAVPEQRCIANGTDLDRAAAGGFEYPVVVKPARSVVETAGGRAKSQVIHAADPAELASALASLPSYAFPVLVQERVVGPGVGVFLLVWEGEVLASFAHRRLREKPPSGGVSVYRESIALDPGLLDRSRALLDALDWNGVAMVEYKVSSASGTPHLMEINGRFWGSLQLAIDAGVDFPSLLVDAATGRRPDPVESYRTGVRSRWWWGDVDHLLLRLRRSRRELDLTDEEPGRLRSTIDFLMTFVQRNRSEVMRLTDPVPALVETADWLRGR